MALNGTPSKSNDTAYIRQLEKIITDLLNRVSTLEASNAYLRKRVK